MSEDLTIAQIADTGLTIFYTLIQQGADPLDPQEILSRTISSGLGGIIGGAIGGAIVLLIQRLLNRLGTIDVSVKPATVKVYYSLEQDGSRSKASKNDANVAEYAFNIRFFNGKSTDTGINEVSLEFFHSSKPKDTVFRDEPDDAASAPSKEVPTGYEKMGLINLPSGQWVEVKCRGSFKEENTQNIAKCDKVRFVGLLPKRKNFLSRLCGSSSDENKLPWEIKLEHV